MASIYGSMATGLAIESSDVDIVIQNIQCQKGTTYADSIYLLSNSLEKLPFIKEHKVIPSAEVPLIKLVLTNCNSSVVSRNQFSWSENQ